MDDLLIHPTSQSAQLLALAEREVQVAALRSSGSLRSFNLNKTLEFIDFASSELNNDSLPDELHFGAKIALTLLAATAALVAGATLLDIRESNSHTHWLAHQPDYANRHQPNSTLRDQRSASVSSAGSSTLCCSANSVASASVPILSARKRYLTPKQVCRSCVGNTWFSNCHHGDCCTSSASQQYEHNLNLASGQTDSNKQTAGSKLFCSGPMTPARPPKSFGLARELLLAFSLRHSARLIFQRSEGRSAQASSSSLPSQQQHHSFHKTNTNRTACHISRVSSLTGINENQPLESQLGDKDKDKTEYGDGDREEHCCIHTRHQSQTQLAGHEKESIDTLHGLRFLSMIWIIVMHSYSFALRWLFFTHSNSLNDIYKTYATQLLANGTFACDSFLFAGGFLLPYLAFIKSPNSPECSTPKSPQRRHDSSLSSNASTSLSSSSSTRTGKSTSTTICTGDAKLRDNSDINFPSSKQQQQQQRQQDARDESSSPDSGCSISAIGRPNNLGSRNQAAKGVQKSKQASQQQQQQQQQQQHKDSDNVSSSSTSSSNYNSSCSTSAGPLCNPESLSNCCCSLNEPLDETETHSPPTTNSSTLKSRRGEQIARDLAEKHKDKFEFSLSKLAGNLLHRYIRMMPLMMAIIGLSTTLLRYLGEGPVWENSTVMFDKWCRKNWWINVLFLHNFIDRENMCLGHSWYSAVDLQLFTIGQIILFVLARSRLFGILILCSLLTGAQLLTGTLTLLHHLPAVPLISSFSEQTMNRYYGEIYIKPYCRASPYLIGMLLAYLMRTTSLGRVRLSKVALGWTTSISVLLIILLAMKPAMNGEPPSELLSALYSAMSRPLWACVTGWMIFACITKQSGPFASILGARCFIPLSRLTYPAYLIHPIVMALFYGSRQSTFHFSHYLMLYLILGNIVITYASAFILSALFELPLLSIERTLRRVWAASSSSPEPASTRKRQRNIN